ncbi:MAG: hypothetical protein M1832_005511 [Thelocarpon impressellum]|nr:MAG: hypothetical protein M1832_005511 [Thelocarpon impressellum]
MPVPILAEVAFGGLSRVPYIYPILKTAPWLVLLYFLKIYFGGARNRSERLMHSKVVMITGGTSGVGASVVLELAQRGAQVILLTHYPPSDPFLVDCIDDLRARTANDLIYAEQVDLASLHSIRQFATKWVDNAPPRRLDMVILCAATMSPPYASRPERTADGVEVSWGVNYLANFHLLSILSPALRAQPADRDVRIIMGTCASYIGAHLDLKDSKHLKGSSQKKQKSPPFSSGKAYGESKLAVMIFAQSLQKHLDAYKRPDKQPMNSRVILVDPGWTRTPGMRRWLTAGSLWGLLVYLALWPVCWLLLKSPEQGAQSFLRAAMEAELGAGAGGRLIKECLEVSYARKDVRDETLGRELWAASETQVQTLEKEGAIRRALEKKEREEAEKNTPQSSDGVAKAPKSSSIAAKKPGSRRSRKAG